MDLLSSSLIMATSHFPLAQRDFLHHYPDQHVIRLDMHDNPSHDFATAKPPPDNSLYAPPAAPYTSSPSLDSQTDDDPVFDVDVDYPPVHQHIPYDASSSPSWASASTPRAWVGEPERLSSIDPDSRRSSFAYPTAEGGVAHHHHHHHHHHQQQDTYNLADYFEVPSPAHSPPTAYMSVPGSIGALGPAVGPSSYYPAVTAGSPSHAQHSQFSLPPRYTASLQAHNPGCDPRFVSPAPHPGPSSSPHRQDVGISFADVYSDPSHDHRIKLEQDQQSLGIGPASVLQQPVYDSDSGEDEKSDDDDDPSYVVPSSSRGARPMSLPSSSRMRPRNVRSSSAGSSTMAMNGDALRAQRPTRTPAPEPVPNLTKKSRGRRVPTAASLYGGAAGYSSAAASTSGYSLGSGGKHARTYVCKVKDCGKCFARSEHLKRHVRSIHTNEKPHRCPHPGCNKEFSRHDNLCQHMRVHRNFSAPKDGAFGSF